jgi:hypothetical protein
MSVYRIEHYLPESIAEYADALYQQALQFIKTAYQPTIGIEYEFRRI